MVHMYQIRIFEFEYNGYILLENMESSSPRSTIFECQGDGEFETTLKDVHYNNFIKNIRTSKVLKSKNWP